MLRTWNCERTVLLKWLTNVDVSGIFIKHLIRLGWGKVSFWLCKVCCSSRAFVALNSSVVLEWIFLTPSFNLPSSFGVTIFGSNTHIFYPHFELHPERCIFSWQPGYPGFKLWTWSLGMGRGFFSGGNFTLPNLFPSGKLGWIYFPRL